MNNDVIYHYDKLIDEGNDPVNDPLMLKEYMDKWDGRVFIDKLQLSPEKNVLEIGNIGAGVAVAGAFSLVRFRSAAGSAKEILAVFLSMAVGLATGMGYVTLAVVFFAVTAVCMLILGAVKFGEGNSSLRTLKITIPENLDYDGVFDDLFAAYTNSAELEKVKTANMGTLFELQYTISLKGEEVPKEFIDEIRVRNGNLNITCAKYAVKEAL
ncbi:MAG: DUF4956 domain-containing protein [Clostridia bacterium]|nr:DUF4956 domain-containing protein [Clostridia bacterium]